MYAEAMMIIFEGVQQELTEAEMTRFMWKIRSHPRMVVLMGQIEMQRAGVVDAESRDAQLIEVPEDLLAIL
jgi:hypothetical protein